MERPTFDEHEWQKMFNMRRSEQSAVLESAHWLAVEAECAPDRHDTSLLEATANIEIRTAMLGFQIWCPKGWRAIIVNAAYRENHTIGVNSVFPEHYAESHWARLLRIDDQPSEELKPIIEGTLAALNGDSVPVNPFQYLEIGLQTAVNHTRAGALLWMIGLDALLAAQRDTVFEARLCRLLGGDSYVFPRDFAGRQPAYA